MCAAVSRASIIELRSGMFHTPFAEKFFSIVQKQHTDRLDENGPISDTHPAIAPYLHCAMTSGLPPVLQHVGSKWQQNTAGKAIGATWSNRASPRLVRSTDIPVATQRHSGQGSFGSSTTKRTSAIFRGQIQLLNHCRDAAEGQHAMAMQRLEAGTKEPPVVGHCIQALFFT